MAPDFKEWNKELSISVGAILGWTMMIITITFTVTSVWHRFQLTEAEYLQLGQKIEYVDERHDRKHDRLQEQIDAIKLELEP